MNGAVLLGRLTGGQSADFFADNLAAAWKFTAVRSEQLSVLWAHPRVANPTLTVFELGIYDDDGTGANPNNLLGKADVLLSEARSERPFSAKLAAPVAIVAGTVYWIGLRGAGEVNDFLGDPGAYLEYANTGTFANPWNPAIDNPGLFDIIAWGEAAPPVRLDFAAYPKPALRNGNGR